MALGKAATLAAAASHWPDAIRHSTPSPGSGLTTPMICSTMRPHYRFQMETAGVTSTTRDRRFADGTPISIGNQSSCVALRLPSTLRDCAGDTKRDQSAVSAHRRPATEPQASSGRIGVTGWPSHGPRGCAGPF